ncbi:hypothetical protein QFC22_005394 [Naganishia vaughanmartiniae]|uniref:Uncharacterized protein n=1 Tax=Naganishia vaughanmartiniae TaxID=1424756 RepID=A0ACC2WVA6_9TREE|nr:hypothetical protein QFC22_005394 [Naganishia vaughanmartiniae]
MHISPLLLGVAQLTLATTAVTAVALPRARSRRAHAANFLKLRTPPSSAERFVVPAEPVVIAEKREVIPAEVYRRPTGADGSSSSFSASSASESTVPVSTDSISTSSGKHTEQPDLNISDPEASSLVESLLASASVYETFTYSAYAVQPTPSSMESSFSAAPSASAIVDPIEQAKQAAASYAAGQNGVVNMPTMTVHLVMEPTQEADGSWDYVVKLGADGTPTASPTWVAATATSSVFPTATLLTEESASATEYYVPSSSVGREVSAPISTPAAQDSGEYYYGNTHTYNGTASGSGPSSLEALDTTIRTLVTTSSSHAAFECATTTAYYYSVDSDGIQSCPGGTVCRFVDTACSPCVWPDQDIWCNGNIYPWITATPSLPSSPATTQDSQTSSQQSQPIVTPVISSFSSEITAAPTLAQSTYVTGPGFISASGETGRSAVTFTYTPSATVGPITATEQPTSSYFYGSGYASASGETGRSAITFTYSASSSVIASETALASAAESTAWTSGHGQQHSYPWMTASATESALPTAAPTEILSDGASVTLSTTLSNGAVIVTVAPTQSPQASTTVNSWLVTATKGFDPIYGQPSSSIMSSSEAIPTGASSSSVESGSATVSSYPSMSSSVTSSAESVYFTNPASTYASELPLNVTSSMATPTNAGETATVTPSLTSTTQSANGESASVVSSTEAWASSSSGIFPSSQVASDGSILPTASATFQSSIPVITAPASTSSIEDPTDNGIATETVTDWDTVNATSTTYVPYESASATSALPTAVPSSSAGLNASTSDFVMPGTANSTLTASLTASAEATGAITSPVLHQWPANVTGVETSSQASSTDSAWESAITSAASSTESAWESATTQASSTESAWESAITSQASSSDTQASQSATISDASSSEVFSVTATSTSSAAESTETGTDEDECEEWEEVWVDERDIQDDWIIVE